jgi:hypothetical protein
VSDIKPQNETNQPTEGLLSDQEPDQLRREFLKKFGAYTAGTAVGMFILMSAKTSKAQDGSDTGP